VFTRVLIQQGETENENGPIKLESPDRAPPTVKTVENHFLAKFGVACGCGDNYVAG
jgi:hypothetical protein